MCLVEVNICPYCGQCCRSWWTVLNKFRRTWSLHTTAAMSQWANTSANNSRKAIFSTTGFWELLWKDQTYNYKGLTPFWWLDFGVWLFDLISWIEIQHSKIVTVRFAVPQVTARMPGVNEDVTKSEMARAVNSIPAYVEASSLFIALVPFVQHQDTMEWCSYTTWLSRGWCRAELWLHMLSRDSEQDSVVMINSVKEVKFMFPYDWLQNSVIGGKFSVEGDRAVVVSLCEETLERRIQELEFSGPLRTHRFYRAHQQSMLGQSYSHSGVQAFLDTFRFSSIREAALDQSSMNGMMCAMFCGDTTMLRLLAGSKGDVNLRLHGLAQLGYFDGQTLLVAAAKSSQKPEVLTTLIELQADVNTPTRNGTTVAMMVKSPQHIQALMAAMADFHSSYEPFGFTPLTAACGVAGCMTETIKALLEARCNPNPPLHGTGVAPLHQAIIYSRGQISPLKTVRLLLEWQADPNTAAAPTGDLAARAHAALEQERSSGIENSRWALIWCWEVFEVSW